MKRVCGFAVSDIVMHHYATLHQVAWYVGLSVALTVCHTGELFELSTVLWAFHIIQPFSLYFTCSALMLFVGHVNES